MRQIDHMTQSELETLRLKGMLSARKLVVRIDGEPFVPTSAETLTQLEEEAAQWEDWRERNHACALDDAELEREYQEHQ
jgi:hypothetical protein